MSRHSKGKSLPTKFAPNIFALLEAEDLEVLTRIEQYDYLATKLKERDKDTDDKHSSLSQVPEVTTSIVHQAMDMTWTLGLNWKNRVIFVKDFPDTKSIFYSCGNTAVIYDFHQNHQKLLRGHHNVISSITTSEGRMWLITVDKGKDATINVWEMKSGIPIKTFFNVQPPHGVCVVAISGDRKYLATVSAGFPQVVSVWEWAVGSKRDKEVELCSVTVDEIFGLQTIVHFYGKDSNYLLTSSSTFILFYSWSVDSMAYDALRVSKSDVAAESPGRLLKSIFHFEPELALSSTTKGNVVLWSKRNFESSAGKGKVPWHKQWRMLKVVLIDKLKITEIVTCDEYIITGDSGGFIRFYDGNMHILSWMLAYRNGSIVSISFSVKLLIATEMVSHVTDLTIPAKPFVTRDFVFCTSTAVVGHVTKNTTKVKIILRESASTISAMAVHPTKTELCWVSISGHLRLWDYKDKVIVNENSFEGEITTVCYHPTGKFLGIGFQNGDVHILDPQNLTSVWRPRFLFTNYAIGICAFSQNSQYFACSDETRAIALIIRIKRQWHLIGKFRSHLARIVDLIFLTDSQTYAPRLFSLGLDKALVEYDLVGSTRSKVKLLRRDFLEQSAVPLAAVIYPSNNKDILLIANNEYKLKSFTLDTRRCKNVVLGPVFGSPVKKMALLPQTTSQKSNYRFIAFSAGSLLGLQMLPATGNPYLTMAVHAHASQIEYVGSSFDAAYIFSLNSTNNSIGMWDVHLHVMDLYAELGGSGMDPFCTLLEGGRQGKIFRDLEDYFYYIHLMKQGEESMDPRSVSKTVPVEEIPFIMRALGFFPSEYEIKLMINEVKHSNEHESDELVTEVNIETFLKLYINHRPTFGVALDEVDKTFERLHILKNKFEEPVISKEEFVNLLQSAGEKMESEELKVIMDVLLEDKLDEESATKSTQLEKYLNLSRVKFQRSDVTKVEIENDIKSVLDRLPEVRKVQELTANNFLSELLLVSTPGDKSEKEEEFSDEIEN